MNCNSFIFEIIKTNNTKENELKSESIYSE